MNALHFSVHIAPHNLAEPEPQTTATARCRHCYFDIELVHGLFVQHEAVDDDGWNYPCPGSGRAPFGGQQK